ncbi:hypothetical protein CU097_000776, partial [Rhizopus azygosporus]
PKCSICMQTYSNETFLRPCFHSFCFECICYWINITPESANCPICRQSIQSLVYNVDEENNDFDEYFLKDRQYETHEPPLRRKRTLSPGEKIKLQRKQVYKELYHQTHYPESLPRHANLTIITPEHIPRAKEFLRQDLTAIHDMEYIDPFVIDHIADILLIPFRSKGARKIDMLDPIIIQKTAEWLENDKLVAERLLNELIAYIKSGLSYRDFVSTTVYTS